MKEERFSPMHVFGAPRRPIAFHFRAGATRQRWRFRANACHPGIVRSELMREAWARSGLSPHAVEAACRAAEDLAELAISPAHEGTTGWMFKGTKRMEPPKATLDREAQTTYGNANV